MAKRRKYDKQPINRFYVQFAVRRRMQEVARTNNTHHSSKVRFFSKENLLPSEELWHYYCERTGTHPKSFIKKLPRTINYNQFDPVIQKFAVIPERL